MGGCVINPTSTCAVMMVEDGAHGRTHAPRTTSQGARGHVRAKWWAWARRRSAQTGLGGGVGRSPELEISAFWDQKMHGTASDRRCGKRNATAPFTCTTRRPGAASLRGKVGVWVSPPTNTLSRRVARKAGLGPGHFEMAPERTADNVRGPPRGGGAPPTGMSEHETTSTLAE